MENNKLKQKLQGVVVSDKMDKTVVVEVKKMKMHAKYLKRYLMSKKYKVHDESNQAHIGDNVIIQSCRPISRDKRWILKEIVKKS
ncbi:MAG: 30S ribosomal protein S17 [Candidatus Portnoybacteria bacterium CG10_big_fil_rev_8_21_14_0_10_36_7]|uniref:Small ribosomal subunit protein uS17 n=1 Tax=Candidatus Portnoybacteria bacterium CG10_big_fil_rev_8_21_14_0_10_36_7 TaxID=1974812 RepID=A0A2M8KDF1_9BACT|nr:MAG: 30S ribosomal protein S17 [Candidatus Portnoybacteria bacterium CG10_big_fil_rev_8_21_14_0_10_36_7]